MLLSRITASPSSTCVLIRIVHSLIKVGYVPSLLKYLLISNEIPCIYIFKKLQCKLINIKFNCLLQPPWKWRQRYSRICLPFNIDIRSVWSVIIFVLISHQKTLSLLTVLNIYDKLISENYTIEKSLEYYLCHPNMNASDLNYPYNIHITS